MCYERNKLITPLETDYVIMRIILRRYRGVPIGTLANFSQLLGNSS